MGGRGGRAAGAGTGTGAARPGGGLGWTPCCTDSATPRARSASRPAAAVTRVIASSRFAARPVMTGSIVMMLAHVQARGAELPRSAGSAGAGVAGWASGQVSHSAARSAGGPRLRSEVIRCDQKRRAGRKWAICELALFSPGSQNVPPRYARGVIGFGWALPCLSKLCFAVRCPRTDVAFAWSTGAAKQTAAAPASAVPACPARACVTMHMHTMWAGMPEVLWGVRRVTPAGVGG